MIGSAARTLLGATLGATAGIAAWTLIAFASQRPATFAAIAVGALTGAGVRLSTRSGSRSGSVCAIVVTVLACALGTFVAQSAIVAAMRSTSLLAYVGHLPLFVAVYTFESYFAPTDVVWYALAVGAAWMLALRRTAIPSAEKRAPSSAT